MISIYCCCCIESHTATTTPDKNTDASTKPQTHSYQRPEQNPLIPSGVPLREIYTRNSWHLNRFKTIEIQIANVWINPENIAKHGFFLRPFGSHTHAHFAISQWEALCPSASRSPERLVPRALYIGVCMLCRRVCYFIYISSSKFIVHCYVMYNDP